MNRQLFLASAGVAVLLMAGIITAQAQDVATTPSPAPTPAVTAQAKHVRGLFREPRVIDEAFEFAGRMLSSEDGGGVKNGFYPEFGNMITGAGWISAGPGYRYWLGDNAFVDTSAGISWRAYKMAQARIEVTRLAHGYLTLGSQVRWQDLTQVTYFGAGADSLETSRSEYRLQSLNTVAYANVRPLPGLMLEGRVGWLPGPDLLPPAGAFLRDNPSTHEVFSDDSVFLTRAQPDFAHGEIAIIADTRDHPGYPTRGGVYRVSWARYSDRGAGTFGFRRYEADAAHFVPFARDNIVVALRGWLVETSAPAGHVVPFYLMPSLGGANTLRSFSDYRFHDGNVVLASAETRVALFEHIDAAVFFDAGNVAPAFEDLNLDKTSVGFGVRVHSEQTTVARLDLAHGREGWQVFFRVHDPFRLARLSKRTAALPFAP